MAGLLVALVALTTAAAPPKAIVTILIDDLGSYDTAVNNPDIGWLTPNLEKLSHGEGLRLSRFYVNKFCSPTRRSVSILQVDAAAAAATPPCHSPAWSFLPPFCRPTTRIVD